jgi:hypothetical protein
MYNFNVKVSNLDGLEPMTCDFCGVKGDDMTDVYKGERDTVHGDPITYNICAKCERRQEFEHTACNARMEVGIRIFETTSDGTDEDVYVAPLEDVFAKMGIEVDYASFFMAAYEAGKENSAKIHAANEECGFDQRNPGGPDENPFSDAHIYSFLGAGNPGDPGVCYYCQRSHPDVRLHGEYVNDTDQLFNVCGACAGVKLMGWDDTTLSKVLLQYLHDENPGGPDENPFANEVTAF